MKDSGASAVIVGHSECRRHRGETDAIVAAKAKKGMARRAYDDHLYRRDEIAAVRRQCVVCVRRSDCQQRSRRYGFDRQRVGYEPLWAIGTNQTPTSEEIMGMHAHIRACLTLHFGAEEPFEA